jgi:hypothetical protein
MTHGKSEADARKRVAELLPEYPDPDEMTADEARHLMYRAYVGEIPTGYRAVEGVCGNPACVKPDHTCIVPDESPN